MYIIIWNENIHERENEEIKNLPKWNGCIKNFLLTGKTLHIDTATLTIRIMELIKKILKIVMF